jgi:hypothetical protein
MRRLRRITILCRSQPFEKTTHGMPSEKRLYQKKWKKTDKNAADLN